MPEFRAVVEAGDFAALGELLADDVVFRSPVAFRPYEGRTIVAAIPRGVGRVFTPHGDLHRFPVAAQLRGERGRAAPADGVLVRGARELLGLDIDFK